MEGEGRRSGRGTGGIKLDRCSSGVGAEWKDKNNNNNNNKRRKKKEKESKKKRRKLLNMLE